MLTATVDGSTDTVGRALNLFKILSSAWSKCHNIDSTKIILTPACGKNWCFYASGLTFLAWLDLQYRICRQKQLPITSILLRGKMASVHIVVYCRNVLTHLITLDWDWLDCIWTYLECKLKMQVGPALNQSVPVLTSLMCPYALQCIEYDILLSLFEKYLL